MARRWRLRMILSVRTLIELVAVSAFAVTFGKLREQAEPPGPAVRALRSGNQADRLGAVRDLGVLGSDAIANVPDLTRSARDDPNPAVRRGALFAMMAAVLDEPVGNTALDESLAGPAGIPSNRPRLVSADHALPPQSIAVALSIVEVMETDPDATVRAYAIRVLRRMLSQAIFERQRTARAATPATASKPAAVASRGWVESCTRAIVDRTGDPDARVRGHAIGFLIASKPASVVLPKEEVAAELLGLIGDDGPTLSVEFEILCLIAASSFLGPDHPEASAMLDRLEQLAATTPAIPRPNGEVWPRDLRTAYLEIAWAFVGSMADLEQRPALAETLIAMVSGGRRAYSRSHGKTEPYREELDRYTADRWDDGNVSWSGGLPGLLEPRAAVLRTVRRDPRALGAIWPRIDREGRRGILQEVAPMKSSAGGLTWDSFLALLGDPRARPDLSPSQASAMLDSSLDDFETDQYVPSSDDVAQFKYDLGRQGITIDEAEAAERLREHRAMLDLGVAAYFARGVEGEGANSVGRLRVELVGLLSSADATTRRTAAMLIGSMQGAAVATLPRLEAMSSGDPDPMAQEAAEGAVGLIRGSVAEHKRQ